MATFDIGAKVTDTVAWRAEPMVQGERREKAYEMCPINSKVPSKRRWIPRTVSRRVSGRERCELYRAGTEVCARRCVLATTANEQGWPASSAALNLDATRAGLVHPSMASEVGDGRMEAAYEMGSGCVCEDE